MLEKLWGILSGDYISIASVLTVIGFIIKLIYEFLKSFYFDWKAQTLAEAEETRALASHVTQQMKELISNAKDKIGVLEEDKSRLTISCALYRKSLLSYRKFLRQVVHRLPETDGMDALITDIENFLDEMWSELRED